MEIFKINGVEWIANAPKVTCINMDTLIDTKQRKFIVDRIAFHNLVIPFSAYNIHHDNDTKTALYYAICKIRMNQEALGCRCKHPNTINRKIVIDEDGEKYVERDCLYCFSHLCQHIIPLPKPSEYITLAS